MTVSKIVVMGVSGCGKSTIGQALAQKLGWRFLEGDSLHPPENIAAMSAGIALNDTMRLPWLQAVATALHSEPLGIVGSCSALRRSYRDILCRQGAVLFVHLEIDLQETRVRMQKRASHFMNPALAESQHASLEPLHGEESGITVDARQPTEVLIKLICDELQTHCDV